MRTVHYSLIALFVLGFFSDGITQSFITNWSSHLGSSEEDYALASCVDHQNNVYTLGVFSDTAFYADQQTVTSKGRTDFFLSKHNPSGELLWIKTFGGPEYDGAVGLAVIEFSVVPLPCDIQIDQEGQIYIFGNHKGTGDFDPGPGEYLLSSIGSNNGFILKLTENGDFIFGQSYPHTYFQSMAISDSSIYLSGSFSQSVDFDLSADEFVLNSLGDNAFILKTSHLGDFERVVQFYSNSGISISNLVFDNQTNNLFFSGGYGNNINIDSTIIFSEFVNNISNERTGYISKLNSNLSTLYWLLNFESSISCVVNKIELLDYNLLVISGNYRGNINFLIDNQPTGYLSSGLGDYFISLISKDGDIKRSISIGNLGDNYIQQLIVDSLNVIYFVDNSREEQITIEFNNISVALDNISGIRHAFVVMMDTSFNYINHFSACAGDYIFDINDISIGLNNEINIAGTHSAPAYLCNAPNDVFPQFQGSYDAIGVQLVYDFTTVAGSLSTTISTNIYPNPFTNQINYTCSEEDSCGKIRFELYDITGRLLFTEYKDAVNGQYTILTHQLPVGVFYLRLYGENQLVKSFKMIKL